MDFPITYRIDVFSVFMFLGLVQGFFLSWIFLVSRKMEDQSKQYLGWIIFILSLVTLEIFLCYTGLIVHALHYYDLSEPVNFLYGPLFYLLVVFSVGIKPKNLYWHFIPFVFYLLYSCFFFFQGLPFKYNAFLWAYHPDWPRMAVNQVFPDDPLSLKRYINELAITHVALYLIPIFQHLKRFREKLKNGKEKKREENQHQWLWGLYFLLIFSYFSWVYRTFFTYRDFVDYILATLDTFIIYYVSYFVVKDSLFFQQKMRKPKYSKSSLPESIKAKILIKASREMETNKAFLDQELSLKKIAAQLDISVHHLSQVLNEKLNKTYYEWIAEYRVAEAKRLLLDDSFSHYKLEEIGRMAGFNSKSAFYKAFKKLERLSPAEFREMEG